MNAHTREGKCENLKVYQPSSDTTAPHLQKFSAFWLADASESTLSTLATPPWDRSIKNSVKSVRDKIEQSLFGGYVIHHWKVYTSIYYLPIIMHRIVPDKRNSAVIMFSVVSVVSWSSQLFSVIRFNLAEEPKFLTFIY